MTKPDNMAVTDKCLIGDCRESMRKLIARGVKVQTCVTSPPYWGLRDYGVSGQLGLEATPELYVASMVEVFGLVHELMADDGTLWLNLGDSYSSGGRATQVAPTLRTKDHDSPSGKQEYLANFSVRPGTPEGLKPKDLIGIPWRVAFALQAAGWYLRCDIIWSKPNPMPESVTDRPTKAHEYIFLLSKNKDYYYDADAIKEKSIRYGDIPGGSKKVGNTPYPINGKQNLDKAALMPVPEYRNKRSVWEVATSPYAEAHFATFPPKLIEPCIMAGSRTGDIVLDPFFGSGTTGEVAQRLGRKWIGCELNEAYMPLQERRTAQEGLPL